jgi:hypothetical protein
VTKRKEKNKRENQDLLRMMDLKMKENKKHKNTIHSKRQKKMNSK